MQYSTHAIQGNINYLELSERHIAWLQREMGESLLGLSDCPERWVQPLWDYAQDALLDVHLNSDGVYPSPVTILCTVRDMMLAAFSACT